MQNVWQQQHFSRTCLQIRIAKLKLDVHGTARIYILRVGMQMKGPAQLPASAHSDSADTGLTKTTLAVQSIRF